MYILLIMVQSRSKIASKNGVKRKLLIKSRVVRKAVSIPAPPERSRQLSKAWNKNEHGHVACYAWNRSKQHANHAVIWTRLYYISSMMKWRGLAQTFISMISISRMSRQYLWNIASRDVSLSSAWRHLFHLIISWYTFIPPEMMHNEFQINTTLAVWAKRPIFWLYSMTSWLLTMKHPLYFFLKY